MDFLQPVVDVFVAIQDFLGQIISGIIGIIAIFTSLIDIILDVTSIIPQPLYTMFVTFVNLYLAIATFKIIRKG